MRNSIKRGGAELIFTCKDKRTSDKLCIADFSEQFNFRFENVKPDGNCFFHTLEKYYRYKGDKSVDKKYSELRSTIVDYILNNWREYSEFGIDQEDVLELSEDGVWDNQAGDLVVPAAARALNLQIRLYDIQPAERGAQPTKKRIIRHIYPEVEPVPAEMVNILRINQGHFGLLVPTVRKNNTIKNLTNKVKQLKVTNKNNSTAKKHTKKPSIKVNEQKNVPLIEKLIKFNKKNTTNKKKVSLVKPVIDARITRSKSKQLQAKNIIANTSFY
jgi:hypothetical protein